MVEIVTERLRLRPFRADDLPAFLAYRSAPEVARYQSWDTTCFHRVYAPLRREWEAAAEEVDVS